MTDHILSETIVFFCFCGLFSNTYPKIIVNQRWVKTREPGEKSPDNP